MSHDETNDTFSNFDSTAFRHLTPRRKSAKLAASVTKAEGISRSGLFPCYTNASSNPPTSSTRLQDLCYHVFFNRTDQRHETASDNGQQRQTDDHLRKVNAQKSHNATVSNKDKTAGHINPLTVDCVDSRLDKDSTAENQAIAASRNIFTSPTNSAKNSIRRTRNEFSISNVSKQEDLTDNQDILSSENESVTPVIEPPMLQQEHNACKLTQYPKMGDQHSNTDLGYNRQHSFSFGSCSPVEETCTEATNMLYSSIPLNTNNNNKSTWHHSNETVTRHFDNLSNAHFSNNEETLQLDNLDLSLHPHNAGHFTTVSSRSSHAGDNEHFNVIASTGSDSGVPEHFDTFASRSSGSVVPDHFDTVSSRSLGAALIEPLNPAQRWADEVSERRTDELMSQLEHGLLSQRADSGYEEPCAHQRVEIGAVHGHQKQDGELSKHQLIFFLLQVLVAKYKYLLDDLSHQKRVSSEQKVATLRLVQTVMYLSKQLHRTDQRMTQLHGELTSLKMDLLSCHRREKRMFILVTVVLCVNLLSIRQVRDKFVSIFQYFNVVKTVKKINRGRRLIADNWRSIPSRLTEFWRIFIFRSQLGLKNS